MPARKKKVEAKKVEPEVVVLETPPVEKPILVAEAVPESPPQPQPVPPQVSPEPVKSEPEPTATPAVDIFGPLPDEPEKSSKKVFWIIIGTFAVLGVVAGGIGVYLQNRSSFAITPSPTPKEVVETSPTPAVQLDKKSLQIQILNGSGVTGAAKAAQDYLEGLGYTVSAVGNASSSSYTSTQISIKDSKKDYLPTLKKDLSGQYSVADTADSLEDNSKYDVVIVLGV